MTTQPSALHRPAVSAKRHWLARTFGLFVLLALGWSNQALATIGCEIQPVGLTTQTGPVNTTLNYSFQIVDITGGCAPTVSGTIIPGADTTGGSAAVPVAWSGAPGATINVSVTLGPNGGGS